MVKSSLIQAEIILRSILAFANKFNFIQSREQQGRYARNSQTSAISHDSLLYSIGGVAAVARR
ncbi:MAG: hypothetical protein KGQ60_01600 [Planctomycetes bacterium]|nr:hypothetical protein [Planctomycetota bacterium]